jgi:hypothetical protein
MATVARATATSVPTSIGGIIPGDAATGHLIRDVNRFVENLAPQDTPILTRVMGNRGRRGRSGNQYKLEWGTSANLPHTSNTAEAMDTSETGLDVTTGHGVRFQVWDKIKVYELDANGLPDVATTEEMLVTAISTDTLTVVRGRGTTSGTAFSSGAHIEILGPALPEGQDFTVAPTVYGDFYFNYYQLWQKSTVVTMEAEVTPNQEFGRGEMARRVAQNTRRLKLEVEKSLVQATRNAGNLSTPLPGEMGGIRGFIPSANRTDAADNPITPYDLETVGATLWDSVGDSRAKSLLMSMRTARYFDGLMNKYRQAGMDTTSANLQLRSFDTRVGTFNITPTRWVPEGIVIGVDFDNLSLVFYEGMGWQEKEHATNGAYRQRTVFGKCTLMVEHPETMFEIHNFSTNLADYSRVF